MSASARESCTNPARRPTTAAPCKGCLRSATARSVLGHTDQRERGTSLAPFVISRVKSGQLMPYRFVSELGERASRLSRPDSWAAGGGALSGAAGEPSPAVGATRWPGPHSRPVSVYTSLPLQGASALAARRSSTGSALPWPRCTATSAFRGGAQGARRRDRRARGLGPVSHQNADIVLPGPSALAYLGDFNSGATAIAIPLLNRTGCRASPTRTAVGPDLGRAGRRARGARQVLPDGEAHVVGLAPDDAVTRPRGRSACSGLGRRGTYGLSDGDLNGDDAAASFQLVALARWLVAGSKRRTSAEDGISLAATVAQRGANCADQRAAGEPRCLLAGQVAAGLPPAKLFATDALAQPAFTDAAQGGSRPAGPPRRDHGPARVPACRRFMPPSRAASAPPVPMGPTATRRCGCCSGDRSGHRRREKHGEAIQVLSDVSPRGRRRRPAGFRGQSRRHHDAHTLRRLRTERRCAPLLLITPYGRSRFRQGGVGALARRLVRVLLCPLWAPGTASTIRGGVCEFCEPP